MEHLSSFTSVSGLDMAEGQDLIAALDDDLFETPASGAENSQGSIVITQSIPSQSIIDPALSTHNSNQQEVNSGDQTKDGGIITPKSDHQLSVIKSAESEGSSDKTERVLDNKKMKPNKGKKTQREPKFSFDVALKRGVEPYQHSTPQGEEKALPFRNTDEILQNLSSQCQHLGILEEESWKNYFLAMFSQGKSVSDKEIETWLSAIRHERSTGTQKILGELLLNLNTQVIKLTAQVKILSDFNVSLNHQNENLILTVEKMREQLQNVQVSVPSIPSQSPEHHEIENSEISSADAKQEDWDENSEEVLITNFLTVLGVSKDEINNELIREAVLAVFGKKVLIVVGEQGIPEDEKQEVARLLTEWVMKKINSGKSKEQT